MLVLSRRQGQRIFIGQDTVVEILELRGRKVQVGITAPREVPIYREEILDAPPRSETGPVPGAAP